MACIGKSRYLSLFCGQEQAERDAKVKPRCQGHFLWCSFPPEGPPGRRAGCCRTAQPQFIAVGSRGRSRLSRVSSHTSLFTVITHSEVRLISRFSVFGSFWHLLSFRLLRICINKAL